MDTASVDVLKNRVEWGHRSWWPRGSQWGPCPLKDRWAQGSRRRATGVLGANRGGRGRVNAKSRKSFCLLLTPDIPRPDHPTPTSTSAPRRRRPSLPCRVPVRTRALAGCSPVCHDNRRRRARQHASTRRCTKWPRQIRHAADASALGTQPTGQSASRQNAARSQPAAAALCPETATRQHRRRALASRRLPHRHRPDPTRPPRRTRCRCPRVTHCPRWQTPLARQPIGPLDPAPPAPPLQSRFAGHEHHQRHGSRLHPAHQRRRHEPWCGERSGLEPRVAAHAALQRRRRPGEDPRGQQRRLDRRERKRALVQEEDG